MLMYVLDKNSSDPVYIQIYDHIRQDIETGILRSGEKLPSKRAFAEQNGISKRIFCGEAHRCAGFTAKGTDRRDGCICGKSGRTACVTFSVFRLGKTDAGRAGI